MQNNEELNRFEEYLSKYIKKDKINHAYLIETNSNNKLEIAKTLAKKIISFDNSLSLEEMILNNDLLVIESDSNTIKTEEIESLKEKLKTKSINGNKRIYIINGAEKLNASASNKLLKFIEEPEDDIVAILVTENKNNVITTILSRCQLLRFIINEDKFNVYEPEYIDALFAFINNVEENKEKAIAYQNKFDIKQLSDRKYLQDFLNNLLYIYDDVIQFKVNKNVNYFPSNIDRIEKISNQNDIRSIKNKVNAINTCIGRIKYNPNVKLLIDKLIILMTGVDIDA